jgi:acetyl esterase/lipase
MLSFMRAVNHVATHNGSGNRFATHLATDETRIEHGFYIKQYLFMKSARAFVILLLLVFVSALHADPKYKRKEVIYGHKAGMALTMDVFTPEKPNGYGVVWVVSGGWFSAHEAIPVNFFPQLLDRGYTVFAVCHGSQPKFTITEIVPDMMRSVRYIRHNAKKYGIDPDKLGVSGGSAGGHLSLTLGTQGGPGDPKAKDPIDQESSAVQSVACFFPPTDFLNYGKPGEDGVGFGILKGFKAAFGSQADTPEGRKKLGHDISPIYFVHTNQAPILIIHGDADNLVPIQQAQTFVAKCKEKGDIATLSVRPGKGHGWQDWQNDVKEIADWHDGHLRGLKKSIE